MLGSRRRNGIWGRELGDGSRTSEGSLAGVGDRVVVGAEEIVPGEDVAVALGTSQAGGGSGFDEQRVVVDQDIFREALAVVSSAAILLDDDDVSAMSSGHGNAIVRGADAVACELVAVDVLVG